LEDGGQPFRGGEQKPLSIGFPFLPVITKNRSKLSGMVTGAALVLLFVD
jgi:hypothetical protein